MTTSATPTQGGVKPFHIRVAEGVQQAVRAISLVWATSRAGVTMLLGLTGLAATLPIVMTWTGKLIIDAVVAARAAPTPDARQAAVSSVVHWIVVEFLLLVAAALVERGLSLVRQLIAARVSQGLSVRIMSHALAMELAQFENPTYYDMLTRARQEAPTRPFAMVQDAINCLRGVLTLAGFSALLIRFNPWCVFVLLAAAIPAFFSEARFSAIAYGIRHRRSARSRKLSYLEGVATTDTHVKEVRLFELGPLLLERYRALADAFLAEDRATTVRRTVFTWLLSLVAHVAYYGCYAAVALAGAAGRLSLGEMTLYAAAFRQGQTAFQSILGSIASIYENRLYVSNLFEFLALPTPPPVVPRATAVSRDAGIRFENVGFRYPEAESWVLRGLRLHIPAGRSVALVGENGAGKTTFIKLLTRLYRPTEGTISLDGRSLEDWPESELRRRIGAVFQDFSRYQLLVRDNVGFGSTAHLADDARLSRALDRSGAVEMVAQLPAGFETQLGRHFERGVDLSGGQWQKLALARAYLREEADILILDEPTAALDAVAERAAFERFQRLTKGRTAIVVSHRFPTVRMADQIVVLAHGGILERGTHAALVARGGTYARMFALQAEGYR